MFEYVHVEWISMVDIQYPAYGHAKALLNSLLSGLILSDPSPICLLFLLPAIIYSVDSIFPWWRIVISDLRAEVS